MEAGTCALSHQSSESVGDHRRGHARQLWPIGCDCRSPARHLVRMLRLARPCPLVPSCEAAKSVASRSDGALASRWDAWESATRDMCDGRGKKLYSDGGSRFFVWMSFTYVWASSTTRFATWLRVSPAAAVASLVAPSLPCRRRRLQTTSLKRARLTPRRRSFCCLLTHSVRWWRCLQA